MSLDCYGVFSFFFFLNGEVFSFIHVSLKRPSDVRKLVPVEVYVEVNLYSPLLNIQLCWKGNANHH